MTPAECRRRVAGARFATLATTRPDGAPHLVPITFAGPDPALLGPDVLVTAVDHKPKSDQRLQRLVNLDHDPRCAVLVDHTDPDWTALWWVRGDAVAEVVDEPAADHPGIVALVDRHPQYRTTPPAGPLVVLHVSSWSGWGYTSG